MQTPFTIQSLEPVVAPMSNRLCESWGPGWFAARVILGGLSLGVGLAAYCLY